MEGGSQQNAVWMVVRRLKMFLYPSRKFTFLNHGPIMPKYVTATAFHDTAVFLDNSDVILSF